MVYVQPVNYVRCYDCVDALEVLEIRRETDGYIPVAVIRVAQAHLRTHKAANNKAVRT